MYYVYLRDWFSVINRNRFKIIRSDDYYNNSVDTLQDVAKFLDLGNTKLCLKITLFVKFLSQ